MHCPRCGSIATTGQQYCRACGLNLEKVAEAVGEELGLQPAPAPDEISRLQELQRKHENWGGKAGMFTFGLVLLLFGILVFTQMIMKGGALIILGSILILLAVGAAIMVYFQASAKSLKDKLEARSLPNSTVPLSIPSAESVLPPASVTERTTELLSPHPVNTGKIND